MLLRLETVISKSINTWSDKVSRMTQHDPTRVVKAWSLHHKVTVIISSGWLEC